jgi:hypothetical protein
MEIIRRKGHGGREAYVREDLAGKHWEHSLCIKCDNYLRNGAYGCAIATELMAFNLKTGTTTPMWECPDFVPEEDE